MTQNCNAPAPRLSIGFTGTRHGMSLYQKQSLRARLSWLRGKYTWFHHGDEAHSDCEAALIARDLGYKIAVHPPTDKRFVGNWQGDYSYEAVQYLSRNRSIVDNCDVLLAAPLTAEEYRRSGTWQTIRYARKLDRKIVILNRTE